MTLSDMNWIKVSERLPERAGYYLAIDNKYQGSIEVVFYGLPKKGGDVPMWHTQFGYVITHWMPLPAPPTEEN